MALKSVETAKNFTPTRRQDTQVTSTPQVATKPRDGKRAMFTKLPPDALKAYLKNGKRKKKCLRMSETVSAAVASYAHRRGQNFSEYVEELLLNVAQQYLAETGVSQAELSRGNHDD